MSVGAHVVGCEVCSALGLTAATSAAAVRAGISRVGDHPFMVDDLGDPLLSAVVQGVDPTMTGPSRMVELLSKPVAALGTRLVQLQSLASLPVFVAVPEHRPGWTEADEQSLVAQLTTWFIRSLNPNAQVVVAERGHASALVGIDKAKTCIEARVSEAAVVLAVDSYFHADTVDWLLEHDKLVTAKTRSSFIPGEAAGTVVLMADMPRRAMRLPTLGLVRSAAAAREPIPIDSDEESFGHGMSYAVRQAATSLQLPNERVNGLYLDVNGERYRGQEWGFVALRSGHAFVDPIDYVAPAGRWGDLGAASGLLFTALAEQAWARRYAKGPRAMMCAGSESGLRAAVVLQDEGRDERLP